MYSLLEITCKQNNISKIATFFFLQVKHAFCVRNESSYYALDSVGALLFVASCGLVQN